MPEERRRCGDCALYRTPGCRYANSPHLVMANDEACPDFVSIEDRLKRSRKWRKLLGPEVSVEEGVFTFESDGLRIKVLQEDGVRVPASQLFYRWGDEFIIGELTYVHAIKERLVKDGSESYETIIPLLAWARYRNGELVERQVRPYEMARKLELQGRPILVELRTRYAGTHETLMSLEAVQAFQHGVEPPEWRDVFLKVRDVVESFVSFSWDPRLYDVVSCYVLATYFAEVFRAFPYLYAYGSQGSGKTRLLLTVTYLARHGFVVTDPSDASIYRVAEAFRPTMGIDESLLGRGAWKIIRTAFKKGFKVPRVEKTTKEEFVLALFETYMPVVFASTERPSELGGSEADEARAIFVFMQRSPDPKGRDPEPWEFQELRDQLYLLRLLRPIEVIETLRKLETVNLGLYGHDREVWLPIFTVASLVGEDVYENVKAVAVELLAIKRQFQYQDEKTVIGAILRLMNATKTVEGEEAQALEFKASELLPYIREELEDRGEYEEHVFERVWTPQKVGRILTRMGLFRRMLHGTHRYTVSREDLKRLAIRYECEGVLGGLGGAISKEGYEEEGEESSQPLFKNTPPNPPNPPIEELADRVHTVKPIGAYVAKCPLCGREDAVISYRYETLDGESGDVCTSCGQELLKRVRRDEEA